MKHGREKREKRERAFLLFDERHYYDETRFHSRKCQKERTEVSAAKSLPNDQRYLSKMKFPETMQCPNCDGVVMMYHDGLFQHEDIDDLITGECNVCSVEITLEYNSDLYIKKCDQAIKDYNAQVKKLKRAKLILIK